jgi:type I restriction enzyme M protein
VLIFQKGWTTDNVWFYDMEADGFSLDDKRQKITDNDIPDIIDKWKRRINSKSTIRNSKFFPVPALELRSNKYDLSISRYKEIEHKEIEYEKPDVIMKKLLELESKIGRDVKELQGLIQ